MCLSGEIENQAKGTQLPIGAANGVGFAFRSQLCGVHVSTLFGREQPEGKRIP